MLDEGIIAALILVIILNVTLVAVITFFLWRMHRLFVQEVAAAKEPYYGPG